MGRPEEDEQFQSEELSESEVKTPARNVIFAEDRVPGELKPRIIKIVSKSKKHVIVVDHLNEIGSKETQILKKSVIFNMYGIPKMYAK